MLSTVSRYMTLAMAFALSLAIAAGPAMAQAQQTPPPSAPASPSSPSSRTPAEKPSEPKMGTLEGSVKKVDPAAGTVQVSSGPFGILGRTLEVTNDTQIQVQGRQGTLADLREGTKVKASYESRDGKNVAKQIDVMTESEEKGRTGQTEEKGRTGQTPPASKTQ